MYNVMHNCANIQFNTTTGLPLFMTISSIFLAFLRLIWPYEMHNHTCWCWNSGWHFNYYETKHRITTCWLFHDICSYCVHFHLMIIEDDNPWVIHTNKLTIDRLELETWTNTSVVRDMAGAVSVDYHFTKGFIFYSDQTADRVSR